MQKFKVGQWVLFTKRSGTPDNKNVPGIVKGINDDDETCSVDYQYPIYGTSEGTLATPYASLEAIKAPEYVVMWSVPEGMGRFAYFAKRADAEALAAKLIKRRGDEKAIECGVFKRMK